MIRSVCFGLALLVSGPALAADTIDINFDAADPPGAIGIDNCESRLAEAINLYATPSLDEIDDGRTPIIRVYFYTGSAVCTREAGLAACPSATTDDDGSICGCAGEQTNGTTEYTLQTSVGGLVDEASAIFCVDGAPSSVRFASELYFEAQDDLSAESILSAESESITIDRTRPEQPSTVPRITSAENALQITVDEVSGADSYEICVRNLGEESTPVDEDNLTNETLREGFTSCVSNGVSAGSAYRFEGLTNDVNYEVVYAAVDAAGNRGPNSESASGQPVPQRDFAEQYTARLGGAQGETGGFCAATPGESPSGGWWLLLVAPLTLLRRRRD